MIPDEKDESLKNIRIADMVWAALWEEPEKPASGILKWILMGAGLIVAILVFFIVKK